MTSTVQGHASGPATEGEIGDFDDLFSSLTLNEPSPVAVVQASEGDQTSSTEALQHQHHRSKLNTKGTYNISRLQNDQLSICRSPSEGDLSRHALRPVYPPEFKEPSQPTPGQPSTDSGLADTKDGGESEEGLSQSIQSSTFSDGIKDKEQTAAGVIHREPISLDQPITGRRPIIPTTTGQNSSTEIQQRASAYFKRTQIKTDFQQQLLRLLMDSQDSDEHRSRNVLFALFEPHNPFLQDPDQYSLIPYASLLHYDYYVSHYFPGKSDKHSEAYLFCELQNIQCCIEERILEIEPILQATYDGYWGIHMTIFSKNSPCKKCGNRLINFITTFNAVKDPNRPQIPKIIKLTVQYVRHYHRFSQPDLVGLERITKFGQDQQTCKVEHKPLDRAQFFALFSQWVETHTTCKTLTRPCVKSSCASHTTSDRIYNDILFSSVVPRPPKEDIEKELMRLAWVELSEESLLNQARGYDMWFKAPQPDSPHKTI